MAALSETHPLINIERKKPSRTIIIEPCIILYALSRYSCAFVTFQYIFTEVGKQHNYTQAGIGKHANRSHCTENESDPRYYLQQTVERESSLFALYLSVVESGPIILVSLYIGGYSDRRGRRPGILLPVIGQLVRTAVCVWVIYCKVSIYYLFLAAFINGISGSSSVFLTCALSYVADCTSHENRSRRVTVAEVLMGCGDFLACLLTGYMVSYTGFVWPIVTSFGIVLLTLFYGICFIPETVVSSSRASIAILKILKENFAVFNNRSYSGRPKRLVILLTALVCIFMISKSSATIEYYFFMDSPFCFTSTELGYLKAACSVSVWIGAIFGIVVFLKILRLSDLTCSVLGILSYIARHSMYGVAESRLLVYFAIPAGFLEYMGMPILKSKMSKLVTESEQGSLFAVVGLAGEVAMFVVNFAWPAIYANTLLIHKGIVFLVMTAVLFVGLILVLYYKFTLERNEITVEDDIQVTG